VNEQLSAEKQAPPPWKNSTTFSGSAPRTQKLNSLPSAHWQSPPGTTRSNSAEAAAVVVGASVLVVVAGSLDVVAGAAVVGAADVAAAASLDGAALSADAPSSSSLHAAVPVSRAATTTARPAIPNAFTMDADSTPVG